MSRMFFRAGAVALVAVAAGCTDVTIEDAPGIDSRAGYHKGEFDYAVRNGAIVTTVVGNPFGGSKEAFNSRVLGLMKHQNRGLPADFVAASSERTDPVFNVVVAFNLPRGVADRWLCKEPGALETAPHAGNIRMTAAFCHGDALQSGTSGVARDLAGPDDPKFAALIRGVTNAMVPVDTVEEESESFRP